MYTNFPFISGVQQQPSLSPKILGSLWILNKLIKVSHMYFFDPPFYSLSKKKNGGGRGGGFLPITSPRPRKSENFVFWVWPFYSNRSHTFLITPLCTWPIRGPTRGIFNIFKWEVVEIEFEFRTTCFDTMINYHLSPKFKLLRNDK